MGRKMAVLICAFFCLVGTAHAATWYVATNGTDAAGRGTSPATPFLTIQYAVNAAASGDTINVAAGRYTKAAGATMVANILNKSNLTIQGDAAGGTIIDGSDHTINGGWSGPNANGVYQISKPYAQNGQWLLISVDEGQGAGPEMVITGSPDAYSGATFYSSPGSNYSLWQWSNHMNYGITSRAETTYLLGVPSVQYHTDYDDASCDGYATLRGQAFHNATGVSYSWPKSGYNDGYLYLKLVGDSGETLNVNNFTVKCTRKTIGGTDCGGFLLDSNADNITIRNLHFENGFTQIKIIESDGAIIENCSFLAYKYGIRMWGDGTGNAGAGSVTVRYCEFDVNPFALRSGYTSKHNEFAYLLWKTQKEWGDADLLGIHMDGTKGGHHFHDNYLHDGWDGIGGGANDGDWENTEVDHNLITNNMDDSIEIFGDCSNAKVHHNVIINGQQLTRIRAIDTDSPSTPFYFYNNALLRGPMVEQAILLSAGVTGTGTAYFYQNTIEGGADNHCSHGALQTRGIFCNQTADATFDNWWFANNLFHGFQWTKWDPSTSPVIDWQADYNVYALNDNFASWTYPGRIDTLFNPDRYIDQVSPNGHSVWSTSGPNYPTYDATVAAPFTYTDNYDVSLVPGSPAINKGTSSLTTLFGVASLPGDLSNDCGAIAEGASMLEVPRAAGPVLNSITPSSGVTAGGTACTLAGASLTGTTAVKFGGTSATGVVVDSATQVRCTSPAKTAGSYSVVATVSGVDTNGVNFTYVAPPTLSSINPSSGSAAGGTACTLTGTNLTGCSAVSFGGTAGTGISVVSATEVRCTSPAKTAGTYSTTATTPGGTSSGVNYTFDQSGGTTTTLNPTKDTYIYSYAPTTQYGTVAYIRSWDSASHRRQSYMTFSLAGLSGTVTDAKLRLYNTYTSDAGGAHPLNVYSCDTDSWSESMTWTSSGNGPYGSQLVTTNVAHTVNTWYEFSSAALTSYVNTQMAGDDLVSLVLLYDEGNYQKDDQWASRESANDPQLVVVTQ